MKKQAKSILDTEVSKEKRLLIIGLVGALILGVVFVAGGIPISSKTVYGVTTSLTVRETEEGGRPIVRAQLESGQIIVAGFPKSMQFQKNKKAEFIGRRSLLGQTLYSFNRYIE